MEYTTAVQQIAIDLLNTLRWIALVFCNEYTKLAEEIDTNVFDVGFFQFSQWFLVITAVGMIATKNFTPTKDSTMRVSSRIQSYVTSMVQQQSAAREHDNYAQGKIDSVIFAMHNIDVTPLQDALVEPGENGDIDYSWVTLTFLNCVSITKETYPYNTVYTVKVLDKLLLSQTITGYFMNESAMIANRHPDAFGENYTEENRADHDEDMALLVSDCEDAAAIKDMQENVAYGSHNYKLTDYYSALNAELSTDPTERYCTHSDLLSPYTRILDSVEDVHVMQQIETELLQTEVEPTLDTHRWTYP